jgi:hypothetical protein
VRAFDAAAGIRYEVSDVYDMMLPNENISLTFPSSVALSMPKSLTMI